MGCLVHTNQGRRSYSCIASHICFICIAYLLISGLQVCNDTIVVVFLHVCQLLWPESLKTKVISENERGYPRYLLSFSAMTFVYLWFRIVNLPITPLLVE